MLKQALKDQENHHGSIPGLELVGTRCGAESSEFMRSFSPGKYAKAYWGADSECVLKWIRDTKTCFKTFVHNRLATIHDVSEVECWRYVPSNLNPWSLYTISYLFKVCRGHDPKDSARPTTKAKKNQKDKSKTIKQIKNNPKTIQKQSKNNPKTNSMKTQ
jgi:hypothetical protein